MEQKRCSVCRKKKLESDCINREIFYLVIIPNKAQLLAPLAILGVSYDTCKVSNTLTNDKFPTIHSASAM